jgi:hypothetical protein
MVSIKLREVVEQQGLYGWPQLTADRGLSEVVTHLLEITHSQWIYRNLIVHDEISGTLISKDKENLMAEIMRHVEVEEKD